MKIEKMISQHRRDFTAIMKCEFCGHEEMDGFGYDDRYYHDNVIPNMKCKKCGESTMSNGGTVEYRATKYPEGFHIQQCSGGFLKRTTFNIRRKMKKVTPDMVNEWLSQSICLSPIHPTYVHTMSKETFLFAFKDEVYPKSKEKRVEIAKYSEDGYLGIFGQNRCYLLRDKDFILPIH